MWPRARGIVLVGAGVTISPCSKEAGQARHRHARFPRRRRGAELHGRVQPDVVERPAGSGHPHDGRRRPCIPSRVPQQPSDFASRRPRRSPRSRQRRDGRRARRRRPLDDAIGRVRRSSANYLAFGYTAVQNGVLVLYGWLFDLSRANARQRADARQAYLASTADETGARKVAHEFAADIHRVVRRPSRCSARIFITSPDR